MPVVHTVQVKSVSCGRLYCGIDSAKVRTNGEFGFLGEYANDAHGVKNGQTQVRVFEEYNHAKHQKAYPLIIMQPEMMYDNSRMSNLKLSNWKIDAKTPFVCVPLELGDKIQVTDDVFLDSAGNNPVNKDLLQVKRFFRLNYQAAAQGSKTKLIACGSQANQLPQNAGEIYFEIVKVTPAHSRSARIGATVVGGNITEYPAGGAFANDNYNLYTLELRVKQ